MTSKHRVALFIDAENASAKHLPDYLDHCRQLGKLAVARCYGGPAGLKKWEKAMAENHIVPMQTPPSADKENASDFALTIDAVSLLHRGMFDHAVIASSDADFIQLAMHIREFGKGVDGVGEQKATRILRAAFDAFVVIGVPKAKPIVTAKPKPSQSKASPAARKSASTPAGRQTPDLLSMFESLRGENSSVSLRRFGDHLAKHSPDLKIGHRTWKNFLNKSGLFVVNNDVVERIGA